MRPEWGGLVVEAGVRCLKAWRVGMGLADRATGRFHVIGGGYGVWWIGHTHCRLYSWQAEILDMPFAAIDPPGQVAQAVVLLCHWHASL